MADKAVAATAITLSAALFLLANGAGLSDPGLQYDELLFVNAVLGDSYPYHGFIYSAPLGIPTMLMPYIGALKAWLYTPIFSVFGVTVDSIRLPALLLAALALGLLPPPASSAWPLAGYSPCTSAGDRSRLRSGLPCRLGTGRTQRSAAHCRSTLLLRLPTTTLGALFVATGSGAVVGSL